jgi:hypothetical protein
LDDANERRCEMRSAAAVWCVGLLMSVGSAIAQTHVHGNEPKPFDPKYDGQPGSVTGYIRDAACLLRNPDGGAPASRETLDCARKCVEGGSPLVVFTTDKHMYFIISTTDPDTAQHRRFLPYVGKLVRASGRVFERDGVHGIAIQTVDVLSAGKDAKE